MDMGMGTLTSQGLVLDSQSLENFKKKKVSASTITGLNNCPASWGYNSFYSKQIPDEDIEQANILGNIIHNTLEEFYYKTPKERTKETFKECLKKTLLSHPLVREFEKSVYSQKWVKNIVNNFWELEPNPEKVNIAQMKTQTDEHVLGLEYFISTKIGKSTREFLGFIDRIIKNNDGSITVQDYKTGKIKTFNTKTRQGDGLDQARQQTLYAIALENLGHKVDKTHLVFPMDTTIVNIDHTDQDFRQECIKSVENTATLMDEYCDNNLLPYSPSVLCAWCPLAKICPKATIFDGNKHQNAFNKQHDATRFDNVLCVEK